MKLYSIFLLSIPKLCKEKRNQRWWSGRSKIMMIMKPILITIVLMMTSFSMSATTYYVSSSTGNDANNGTSTATPWKTPNKVTHHAPFQAGDSILLKRGDVFQGEITQQNINGTPTERIVIGAYGIGEKPIIYGDMTGATWTKTAGRDSIWQAFSGYFYSAVGYEDSLGVWRELRNGNQGELHFYLNNADSLKKFLDGLTASSYGYGKDTVWAKTWDGNSPKVRIFHEANFIRGNYVTVRDWDLRNFVTGVKSLSGGKYTNMILHNISIKNTLSIAIFLTGHYYDCLVDSCTVDSAGYTALYNQFGRRNKFRYNTVSNVGQYVLGIFVNGSELCGIGMQQDTACVAEYNFVYNIADGAFDTYYNVDDTVRYNTFTNVPNGVYLNGDGWVAHNNNISATGRSGPGIRVDIHGTGQTRAENNIISSAGGGLVVGSSEPGGGTVVFYNNHVKCSFSNSNFDDFGISSGITSTYNTFCGSGRFATGVWPNQVFYSTLSDFQVTTGYEEGSVWYSICDSPIGTFTVTPDTLPLGGGSVTLEWTSMNATSASIIPEVGAVAMSGTTTVEVHSTTVFTLSLFGPGGFTTYSATVFVVPLEYALGPNKPNPFNESTTIEFTMKEEGYATLKVYDLLGREIETLAEGTYSRGVHKCSWLAKGLPNGVYYYRFTAGSYTETRSMILVR